MTTSPDNKDPASDLWTFFSANVKQIASAYDSGDIEWLSKRISPRVKAIAKNMNWEIGPYHHPDYTFVLSPTTRENLTASKAAIARAPTLPGWRFEPAKPSKELHSLVLEAEGFTICADDWLYQLTSYNDGEFVDIELFYDSSTAPPAELEHLFCEFFVEAILGEEVRLDRVGDITPILADDLNTIDNATEIQYLKEHLNEVLRNL